jgi:hypothetical protein
MSILQDIADEMRHAHNQKLAAEVKAKAEAARTEGKAAIDAVTAEAEGLRGQMTALREQIKAEERLQGDEARRQAQLLADLMGHPHMNRRIDAAVARGKRKGKR